MIITKKFHCKKSFYYRDCLIEIIEDTVNRQIVYKHRVLYLPNQNSFLGCDSNFNQALNKSYTKAISLEMSCSNKPQALMSYKEEILVARNLGSIDTFGDLAGTHCLAVWKNPLQYFKIWQALTQFEQITFTDDFQTLNNNQTQQLARLEKIYLPNSNVLVLGTLLGSPAS
jgi:hypothetical protein